MCIMVSIYNLKYDISVMVVAMLLIEFLLLSTVNLAIFFITVADYMLHI